MCGVSIFIQKKKEHLKYLLEIVCCKLKRFYVVSGIPISRQMALVTYHRTL